MTPESFFAALWRAGPTSVVLRTPGVEVDRRDLEAAVALRCRRLTGSRVLAVLADNGPEWVMADLAALHCGVAHLPLPAFFSDAQLRHAITAAGVDTLWTDDPARILALGVGFHGDGAIDGFVCLTRRCDPVALPEGTAKISFTSGSSGTPKGTCLDARRLLATAESICEALGDVSVERHLAVLPLALLLENVAGVYAPLLRRATVDLPPLAALGWRGMAGFDPGALQAAVMRAAPQSAILVPELLKAWTLHLASTGTSAPGTLAYVAVGGAHVAPSALRQARACRIPAYQGYGLTECGSVVCLNRPGDDGAGVGRPLGHVGVRVREGEVVVDGAPFLGYLGDPAAGARSGFPTGDLGRIDPKGHLHLEGRRSNLLITGYGRNVAPEWIESTLLAQPEITQAIVFGDGMPHLGALLVPFPGQESERIRAAVTRANEALPDYARVRRWVPVPPFTAAAGLLTGNGRPVRAEIHRRYAGPIASIAHVATDMAPAADGRSSGG